MIPPKRLIVSLGWDWFGDSLLFRVFSLHHVPQANISTPLLLHSKVGHGIWQTSAELRKPKRVKVHVTCSYWDFLGLAGSFTVGTFGIVFQKVAICTGNAESKDGYRSFCKLHLYSCILDWAYRVKVIFDGWKGEGKCERSQDQGLWVKIPWTDGLPGTLIPPLFKYALRRLGLPGRCSRPLFSPPISTAKYS